MDFRLGPDAENLRDDVSAFLETAMTAELEERLYRSGVSHDDAFTAALHHRGWLAPGWSPEWGGQGRDALEVLVLKEELQRADAPVYTSATNDMIAKTIARAGSEELKREILPKALSGEILLVLGFSEPESGSDVAAARCRAVRDGEEWVVDGQKMFTTNAHIADYVFLLARTNPDVPKHKGLTMFLVPMDSPGIEVQGVHTLSGERTNITFYSGLRVADRWRVGDVDQGWRVLTSALQDEHSSGYAGHAARLLDYAETWARDTTDGTGRARIADRDVRARLGRIAAELEASTLLEQRAAWMGANGLVPEAEGPMAKLYSTETLVRGSQDALDMLGPDGVRSYFEPTAPAGGRVEHILRLSIGTTIYAGTSEVQRNIIAGRGLGLPSR